MDTEPEGLILRLSRQPVASELEDLWLVTLLVRLPLVQKYGQLPVDVLQLWTNAAKCMRGHHDIHQLPVASVLSAPL